MKWGIKLIVQRKFISFVKLSQVFERELREFNSRLIEGTEDLFNWILFEAFGKFTSTMNFKGLTIYYVAQKTTFWPIYFPNCRGKMSFFEFILSRQNPL